MTVSKATKVASLLNAFERLQNIKLELKSPLNKGKFCLFFVEPSQIKNTKNDNPNLILLISNKPTCKLLRYNITIPDCYKVTL